MTLEKFIIKENISGIFHEKIPNKTMKKTINQFKYIETAVYWYDDVKRPDHNTWIDIEGIGYGWLWFQCKKSEKIQRKLIIEHAMNLYKSCKNSKYYKSVCNDITKFLLEDNDAVYMICCSNSEL